MDELPEADASAPVIPSPAAQSDAAPTRPEASGKPPADEEAVADPSVSVAETSVAIPPVVDVRELDWAAVHEAVCPTAIRARMRATVEAFEALLDRAEGPGLLFDADRADARDRAIQVRAFDPATPLWIIGDLHGDLLALEAALAATDTGQESAAPNIVLLGDLFDDEGLGIELLLRVFELILAAPERVCVVVGNHDEALAYDGNRFASNVAPGDFADFLNANLAHEWIERAGKLAVRLFAQAPHALFLPDGLLISHAGFPLSDLHARLEETGNWNDPACLSDFTWTRAHPTARRKMPNRFTRGSQFGYEDFGAFCGLAARLGRPVTHMVRGHDHVEERYAVYPAYKLHPVLTTVALSRRLPREAFGPRQRIPTIARFVAGALPQVHRLHIPPDIVDAVFPEAVVCDGPDTSSGDAGLQ